MPQTAPESVLDRFRHHAFNATMKPTAADMIARLTRSLAHDFTLMPLEAPASPLFLAIALPLEDSVTGVKPRLPAGRGMTPQQAMIAAGAEALELRASLAQHHVADLAALPRREGLAMAAAVDLLTQEVVTVPAQEVYLDCAAVLAEPLTHDAGSTGCAVGPDRDTARATAVWECIERDAVALWWHGNRPAGRLALELIDAHQPRLFWWLHQRTRVTLLLDLTTDIGLPVVAAVSSGPDGGHVAMGTAARPVLADAALAAVTEMVQTEVSMEMAREAGDPELLAWDAHGSTRVQVQFQSQGDSGAVVADVAPKFGQLEPLLVRLDALGLRALAVDLTLPDDPLPSVRVIIPGLCAMQGRTDTPRFRQLCPKAREPNMPEPY
jgi:ribosomal protein S12 methylthiotransferase accessory factor YcaO